MCERSLEFGLFPLRTGIESALARAVADCDPGSKNIQTLVTCQKLNSRYCEKYRV